MAAANRCHYTQGPGLCRTAPQEREEAPHPTPRRRRGGYPQAWEPLNGRAPRGSQAWAGWGREGSGHQSEKAALPTRGCMDSSGRARAQGSRASLCPREGPQARRMT